MDGHVGVEESSLECLKKAVGKEEAFLSPRKALRGDPPNGQVEDESGLHSCDEHFSPTAFKCLP